MLSRFFTDENPNQALRLRRFMLGQSYYAIWMVVVAVMNFRGILDISTPMFVAMMMGAVISNLVFYTLMRSGANLRFRDPSMTLAQLLVGITWGMALLSIAHEVRDLMLIAYISPVIFGMFRLDQKGFTRLGLYALGGFLLVSGVDWTFYPEQVDATREILRLTVVASMLSWLSYFGLHVAKLKWRLRRQARELERMVTEATELAERDDLTKAYNRRFIMDSLAREKIRADRTEIPFSVCIFDLDNFKLINDRFGHLTGDRVLRAFSERARGELRGLDVMGRNGEGTRFGRYGGEEFIVLLPSTSLLGARNCAERVRHITSNVAFEDLLHVTVSVGVTEYRLGEEVEDTLRRADQALYNAKSAGRNCVEVAGELGSTHLPSDFGQQVVVGLFGKQGKTTGPRPAADPD